MCVVFAGGDGVSTRTTATERVLARQRFTKRQTALLRQMAEGDPAVMTLTGRLGGSLQVATKGNRRYSGANLEFAFRPQGSGQRQQRRRQRRAISHSVEAFVWLVVVHW